LSLRWSNIAEEARGNICRMAWRYPMDLRATIANRLASRQATQELTSLGADELAALGRDVGLCPDQLIHLTARGARAAEELPRLLHAAGLVPAWLELTHPAIMRDMSVTCSGCLAARRCRRDLDRGWAPAVQRYCPNAGTISALEVERRRAVR
jgi:hypothetical protein